MFGALFAKLKQGAAAAAPYKDEVRAWRELCAAMDLEEAALQKANQERLESCPVMCFFWGQNIVGLLVESPVRTAYHGTCSFGWCIVTPCFLWKPDSLAQRCAAHHSSTANEYCFVLQHVLLDNVLNPRTVSLYTEDCTLNRPPRPARAWPDTISNRQDSSCSCCNDGCCACGSSGKEKNCCGDECRSCCTDLTFLMMREAKSLLCVFSCLSSLHPGRCCGPAPIAGCYEDMAERHARWAKEHEDARQARTDAFLATYRAEDYTFTAMRASRRLVAHRVTQGIPLPATRTRPAAVPQPRQMVRV